MYELFWFVGGALTYRFLSRVFALTQAIRVFEHLQLNILFFLGTALEDISYIKNLKYKTMLDSDVHPEDIKLSQMRDEEFFESWKSSCIVNIHKSAPNYFKPSFKDWGEAMALLDEYYKGRFNEKTKE